MMASGSDGSSCRPKAKELTIYYLGVRTNCIADNQSPGAELRRPDQAVPGARLEDGLDRGLRQAECVRRRSQV